MEEGMADILAQSYKVQYQTAYHLKREGYTTTALALLQDLLDQQALTVYRHSITKILMTLVRIESAITKVNEKEADFALYWTLRQKIKPLWEPLADLGDEEKPDDLIEWGTALIGWLEWAVKVDLKLFGDDKDEEMENRSGGNEEGEVDVLASMMSGMRVVTRSKV